MKDKKVMGNVFSNACSGHTPFFQADSSPLTCSKIPPVWSKINPLLMLLGLQRIHLNGAGSWFWSWNRLQHWLQAPKALWSMECSWDGALLLCSQLPPEPTTMGSLPHLSKAAGAHLEETSDPLLQTWNETKDSLLASWKVTDSPWKIKSYKKLSAFR